MGSTPIKKRNQDPIQEGGAWYDDVHPIYENLTQTTRRILINLMDEAKIPYLSITARTKSRESLTEKIKTKSYTNPREQIHDLSGIRIITYIESDAVRSAELVKKTFNAHLDKSLDKSTELGTDRTGYRSNHLVCDLGEERTALPEYSPYRGLLLEIQIRTALQHAWAEIEHDRNYKFSAVLPIDLQRRLNVAAGALELIDREFDALAKAIDTYGSEVAAATKEGNFNLAITTQSVIEYLNSRYGNNDRVDFGNLPDSPECIEELKSFGLHTIQDLDDLFSEEFESESAAYRTTDLGLLRDAMMFKDIDRYFAKAWNNNWKFIESDGLEFFNKIYGSDKISKILTSKDIRIMDSETRDWL